MATLVTMNTDYVKLVVRRLYDAQKLRHQSDLRLQQLVRNGTVPEEVAEEVFGKALEHEQKAEREYEKIVWREIKDFPIIVQWLSKVRGIGTRLGGLLVANIAPIERFANVAKLWAYAGYHVIDGRAAKLQRGQKANWSAELKTTGWKIGGSFIRGGGPYRELYDRYKKRIIAREVANGYVIWKTCADSKQKTVAFGKTIDPPPSAPRWTLGRIDAMGRRYVVKMFLSHLWHVWRTIEGLSTRPPYAIEKLGHETYIDPWDMIVDK